MLLDFNSFNFRQDYIAILQLDIPIHAVDGVTMVIINNIRSLNKYPHANSDNKKLMHDLKIFEETSYQ